MKVSYGITVYNEEDELNRLLNILIHKTDVEDEIVVCVDGDDDGQGQHEEGPERRGAQEPVDDGVLRG